MKVWKAFSSKARRELCPNANVACLVAGGAGGMWLPPPQPSSCPCLNVMPRRESWDGGHVGVGRWYMRRR